MNKIQRQYSCKDEELLPISKFTSYSLKRDKAEIKAVYSTINDEYITQTDAMINAVEELLEPQAERLAKKQIDERLAQNLVNSVSQVNYLEGFLRLAKNDLNMKPADFGISALRKAIHVNDIESVVKNFSIVRTHIETYKVVLFTHGMSEGFLNGFDTLMNAISNDRQKQFEINSNRKAILQENVQKLNELYLRLTDIYLIGKTVYKAANPAKLAEYTFSKLLQNVRKPSTKDQTDTETIK